MRPELKTYQRALPTNEFAALEAWTSTFYPFQQDWLLEPADYAACNKARQTGLSHTTAAVGVLWGAFHGELTTVISLSELLATEVLEKAKRHARVLHGLGSKMAEVNESNKTEMRFTSGGRIIALPSTGGRSFSGNVFLDEFAYQQHPDEIWDAALAVTMHGYKARVASTPNGTGNEFHRLLTDPKANRGWVLHEIPLQRALDDGMRVDIETCWKIAKGDPRLFDQLFNCKFLDADQQYIPSVLIDAATTTDDPPDGGTVFAGLDIGRESDRTALVVVRRDKSRCHWVTHQETKKRTEPEETFPAAELQRKHGAHTVDAVTFTGKSKEELATRLLQSFGDGLIRVQRDGKDAIELRTDVAAIRRIILPGGGIRYDAPRTAQGHADRAWALALALHAAATPEPARGVGIVPFGFG
jgi:phage FluMu gp28-like protein